MVFRKGGRIAADTVFYYGQNIIEIVNTYTYLGVPLSHTGVFAKAANYFKLKEIAGLAVVWKVAFSGSMRNLKSLKSKISIILLIIGQLCTICQSYLGP